jgi:hypothetical protein
MLNKLLLLLILISINLPANASFPIFKDISDIAEPCETLFLKNGTEISIRILEVTPDIVKYKRCNLQNSPEISILKEEVLMIRYSNGDKEIFNLKVDESTNYNILLQNLFSVMSLLFAIIGLIYSPVILGIAAILFGLIGSNSRFNILSFLGITLGVIGIAYFFKPN